MFALRGISQHQLLSTTHPFQHPAVLLPWSKHQSTAPCCPRHSDCTTRQTLGRSDIRSLPRSSWISFDLPHNLPTISRQSSRISRLIYFMICLPSLDNLPISIRRSTSSYAYHLSTIFTYLPVDLPHHIPTISLPSSHISQLIYFTICLSFIDNLLIYLGRSTSSYAHHLPIILPCLVYDQSTSPYVYHFSTIFSSLGYDSHFYNFYMILITISLPIFTTSSAIYDTHSSYIHINLRHIIRYQR
ncbi:hypothetical protein F4780DRAFT_272380 [Xylariomycetidae sp. FL0641]|nr:hypothetical protein F4780DRAFT_272380 [Xylariomycetidae sp. FL0641]